MEETVSYWLSFTNPSLIKSIKVNPKSKPAKVENMDGCLWFKDNEVDKANLFLKKLKEFLKQEYPFVKERASWMNEEKWLKEGMISEDQY